MIAKNKEELINGGANEKRKSIAKFNWVSEQRFSGGGPPFCHSVECNWREKSTEPSHCMYTFL